MTWAEAITSLRLNTSTSWVSGDSETVTLWFRNQSGATAEGHAEVTIDSPDATLAADLAVRTRFDGGPWAAGTMSPPISVPDGQAVRLDIEVIYLPESANGSMDHTLPVDVRVVLAGDRTPPSEHIPPVALPATRAAVAWTVTASMTLVIIGACLTALARRWKSPHE